MDVTRTIAIFLVVLCHVIETEYYGIRTGKIMVSDLSWFYDNILFTLGRLGVPLFLMLSGALLLGIEYDVGSFYKHSLLPLLLTTEIWTLINHFYYLKMSSSPFEMKYLIYDILFLKAPDANHMWYMPMILGMYLIVPFLAKALKNTSFRDASIPFLIGFFAFSVIPFLNAFFTEVFRTLPDINFIFNVAFLGGVYGLLFVTGHYLVQSESFRKIPLFGLGVMAVIALLCNTLGARYFYSEKLFHTDIFGWYTSPFILLASVFLFAMLSRLKITECPSVVTLIARGSFAIYLTHNLVLHFLETKMRFYGGYNVILRSAVRFSFAAGIPFILVFLLSLLPCRRAKKLVFCMK